MHKKNENKISNNKKDLKENLYYLLIVVQCTYFIKHIYMFVLFYSINGIFIHIEVKNNFS